MAKPDSNARNDASVVIAAFTEDEVRRLTGVSVRQLRYWDKTGFFSPSLGDPDRRLPYSRMYSFRDLICLQVISAIRNNAKVPLPHLREVKEELAHMGDDVWAKTTLYLHNKKVVFVNPDTNEKEEIVSGQGILRIPLEVVRSDMLAEVKKVRERDSADIGRVVRKRNVVRNQPIIAGTRVPVSSVKAFAEAGYSVDEIRQEYPHLTSEDIEAAIAFSDKTAA